MGNPIFPIPCPKDQYTLIASNVTTKVVYNQKTTARYLYTYKLAGESAPTLRTESVRMFVDNPLIEIISKNSAIDIYVWCDNEDGILRTEDGPAGKNSFGTNITLDTFNNRVFNHEVFGISKRFDIGSSEVIDIILDTRSFDKETFVLLPFSILGFDAGPLNVDLYAGTVYTGATGTIIDAGDRNQVPVPVTPKVFGVLRPTITTLGTKFPIEFMVPSDGVAAVSKIAGTVKEDLLLHLNPGINYLIRITNTTATTGKGVFGVNWFEV